MWQKDISQKQQLSLSDYSHVSASLQTYQMYSLAKRQRKHCIAQLVFSFTNTNSMREGSILSGTYNGIMKSIE